MPDHRPRPRALPTSESTALRGVCRSRLWQVDRDRAHQVGGNAGDDGKAMETTGSSSKNRSRGSARLRRLRALARGARPPKPARRTVARGNRRRAAPAARAVREDTGEHGVASPDPPAGSSDGGGPRQTVGPARLGGSAQRYRPAPRVTCSAARPASRSRPRVCTRAPGRRGVGARTVRRGRRRARTRSIPSKPHDLRHTAPSLMIAAGINAKALSVYMGHASATITFDLYGHLMPGYMDEAAGMLDAYLTRTAGEPAEPRADCPHPLPHDVRCGRLDRERRAVALTGAPRQVMHDNRDRSVSGAVDRWPEELLPRAARLRAGRACGRT